MSFLAGWLFVICSSHPCIWLRFVVILVRLHMHEFLVRFQAFSIHMLYVFPLVLFWVFPSIVEGMAVDYQLTWFSNGTHWIPSIPRIYYRHHIPIHISLGFAYGCPNFVFRTWLGHSTRRFNQELVERS
jgi:hypothetical protein